MKMNEKIGGTRITLRHIERGAKRAIEARDKRKPGTLGLNMYAYHVCGTSACIMGFAALAAGYRGGAVSNAAELAHDETPTDVAKACAYNSDPDTAPERVLSIIARMKKSARAKAAK